MLALSGKFELKSSHQRRTCMYILINHCVATKTINRYCLKSRQTCSKSHNLYTICSICLPPARTQARRRYAANRTFNEQWFRLRLLSLPPPNFLSARNWEWNFSDNCKHRHQLKSKVICRCGFLPNLRTVLLDSGNATSIHFYSWVRLRRYILAWELHLLRWSVYVQHWTTRLISNGKRSSIGPEMLNRVLFIYDNFTFITTDCCVLHSYCVSVCWHLW